MRLVILTEHQYCWCSVQLFCICYKFWQCNVIRYRHLSVLQGCIVTTFSLNVLYPISGSYSIGYGDLDQVIWPQWSNAKCVIDALKYIYVEFIESGIYMSLSVPHFILLLSSFIFRCALVGMYSLAYSGSVGRAKRASWSITINHKLSYSVFLFAARSSTGQVLPSDIRLTTVPTSTGKS